MFSGFSWFRIYANQNLCLARSTGSWPEYNLGGAVQLTMHLAHLRKYKPKTCSYGKFYRPMHDMLQILYDAQVAEFYDNYAFRGLSQVKDQILSWETGYLNRRSIRWGITNHGEEPWNWLVINPSPKLAKHHRETDGCH